MKYSSWIRQATHVLTVAALCFAVGCTVGGNGGNTNDNADGNTNTNANTNANDNGSPDGPPVEADRVSFGADTGFNSPVTMAVGTVLWNDDAFLDIVTVASNTAGDQAGDVSISLNDGAGSFAAATTVSSDNGMSGGSRIYTADLNGAGGMEVVVMDNGSDSRAGGVLVVVAAGDGGATDTLLPESADRPFAVAFGDVSGDTLIDITVVIGEAADRLLVYAGNGDGTFEAPSSLDLPAGVGDIALADVDEDGDLDLCMSLVASDSETGLNQAGILFGDGAGGFGDLLVLDAGLTPAGVAATDLNGDGHLDLVVGHVFDLIFVFFGNGDGTFESPIDAEGVDASAFAIADVDDDQSLDLIGKAVGATLPRILYGDGDGGFPEFQEFGFSATTAIADFGLADLNNDGRLDFFGAGTFVDTSGGGVDIFEIIVKLQEDSAG